MLSVFKLTAEFLLSGPCLLCEREIGRGVICERCHADLPWLAQTERSFPWGSVKAPWRYEFPIREIICHLKYRRRLVLARFLGELMAEKIAAAEAVTLVPVPLHPRRLRERGFNQSLEIAKVLAEKLALPIETDLVIRIRNTLPQASLQRERRQVNLKGAFAVQRKPPPGKIVLLDDVLTTGTTLSELAATLRRAGADKIEAWVCALA